MNRLLSPLPLALLLSLTSCFSLRIGGGDHDDDGFFEIDGVADAYADTYSWSDYDGPPVDIGVLSFNNGEVASVDLGPIFGVGVGLAGFRLRVFPFDVGLGTLFYDPEDATPRRTRRDRHSDDEDDVEVIVITDEDDDEVEEKEQTSEERVRERSERKVR